MKSKMNKRLLSIVLCIALLMSYLPVISFAAAADPAPTTMEPTTKVADPSTMDSWKDLFLANKVNTENAGTVWTDKSVFTDASAFPGVSMKEENSFLVALSAMGSNMSVTGMSNTPTDTMMILDLSSSMYGGSKRTPDAVKTMVNSVNQTINDLQAINEHNRVGVVIYFGGPDRNQSKSTTSLVLLPLDRYSGTTTFLKTNVSSGKLVSISVNSGVKNSAGKTMPKTTHTVADIAGTYAQLGILDAMNQLLKADTKVPSKVANQPDVTRVPVMIFMSDGEPTAATHEYTKKTDAGMGNNTISIRNPNETDFVTQLTAAYAKEMVDAHYVETDPLFYTLSLGTSVSLAVMDPAKNTTATIDKYWTSLLSDGSTRISVKNSPNGWGKPTVSKTYTVKKTTVDGATFPSGKGQRDYVDKMFTAANASDLSDVFHEIVTQIDVVSQYTPTLITENDDLSGYISFVDKVGQYMHVCDIKGILIDNVLFSGEELAKNFITGGGELGTYDKPTSLGDELVWAVQARLGIDNVDTARTLLGLAYEHGQLSYSETGYSNYIGWYANAAGEFLGFWHENTTTVPEPTGDIKTDPAFFVKSYGYLGKVDESHGVAASDMMYATVQVRQSIATGEQTVAFAVPAALIPVLTYKVELDKAGALESLTVTGADHPIRLVYEVALNHGIDPYTVKDVVSAEYLANHTGADGHVNFYTNQYELDNSTGYGKVNAYSYFNPSRQNSKYYYLEDSPVYLDTDGTLYTGDSQPSGVMYRAYTVYAEDGIHTAYRRLSDAAMGTAQRRNDGSWFIGAGNVHVNLDGQTVGKSENSTGTLPNTYTPFVDAHNHSVGDLGYNFIVGATLGNNGRLTIAPATGIALSKVMADDATAPTSAFQFIITNTTNPSDSETYPVRVLHADGSTSTTTAQFTAGQTTVALNAGETMYIAGMTAGTVFTIEEIQTVDYVPDQAQITVTIVDHQLIQAVFTNSDRGTGDLTISKEIRHDLGSDYTIPEGMTFTMDVTLTGVGVTNATFAAAHTDGSVTSITTDANGCFTVNLAHKEQLTVYGLPAYTTATVVERAPSAGFTAGYLEDGKDGDGTVTIPSGATVSVTVANSYETEIVRPTNVSLKGTKVLDTAASDWNGVQFQFQLQKWAEDAWTTIATATATEQNPSFDFDAVMDAEQFSAPGTYYYQVLETHGGSVIDGITYDPTLHTFGIVVTDKDMDGQLEVDKVVSFHTGREFGKNQAGDYQIDISFHNKYDATGCTVYLDVQKALTNLSGSPLVSLSGFQFGLYGQDGTLIATSELTDGVGEARFILNYELEDAGTHTYILKEIVPQDPIPGMTYDAATYEVVVLVEDNGDGTTSATLSIDGETDFDTPVFTNVYDPDDAQLEIDFVDKKLNGRDLVDGEFTFELHGVDMDVTLTGTNDAQGNVVFNDKLTFNRVGTWHFDLVETSADGNGITTDKTVYHITVTVTDQGGKLVAEHHVQNVVGDTVLFTNTYETSDATYTIRGNKTLVGRVLLNDEFTFHLYEAEDANGTVQIGAKNWKAKNFTDGSFAFEPLTFTEAGTYHYVVMEEQTSSSPFGITYDTTQYVVTITVTDNLEGELVASAVTTIIGGDAADAISFTNRYVPEPTSAVIPGNKILTGKVMNGGEFSFELYASDAAWAQGEKLETVKNGTDGTFTFSQIPYDTVGTWYYLVKEVNGGETIDGVTYDDAVYRVRIDVTDNLRGNLRAAVHVYNSEGISQERVAFLNSYTVTGEAEVELEGTKTLNGRDLVDGEFTFELYEADVTFGVSGNPIQTAVNEDGKFRFDLTYTADHVGNTYYYVVKEMNAGETIDGVTYSNVGYYITVEVLDDGEGGIETVTSITNGSASVTSLDFVNEYETDSVSVTLGGDKLLTGKDLQAGEFTFQLVEANDSWFEIGNPQTVTNGADGKFSFAPITYTTAGTRYYLIQEVNGGETINGVTYDNTIYCVIVDVTDNLNGELVSSLEIYTSEGQPQERIVFHNSYIVTGEAEVELEGTKTLNGRDLVDGEFTFELYEADVTFGVSGNPIQTAVNEDGKFRFDLTYTADHVGNTYYYVVKEMNAGETIDGVTYSNVGYYITVEVLDDGEGGIETAMSITNGSASVTSLDFVNEYETDSVSVTLGGDKLLTGKDLQAGEFTFQLVEANDSWFEIGDPQTVTNSADGKFSFAPITFTTAGTRYYLIQEVNGGETINGVTYDNTIYCVIVDVTDNLNGELVSSLEIYTSEGQPQERVVFENIFTPNPEDVTLDITAKKTVQNIGTSAIGPEGFHFLLENVTIGGTMQATSDAQGLAVFSLTFTHEDIGRVYTYKLSEINDGRENVTYSTAVYNITVAITRSEDNQLVATITNNGAAATEAVGEFENIHNDTPDNPKTSDPSLALWMAMLTVSCGGVISLCLCDKKREETEE